MTYIATKTSELLIMDESTNALNPNDIKELRGLFKRRHSEYTRLRGPSQATSLEKTDRSQTCSESFTVFG